MFEGVEDFETNNTGPTSGLANTNMLAEAKLLGWGCKKNIQLSATATAFSGIAEIECTDCGFCEAVVPSAPVFKSGLFVTNDNNVDSSSSCNVATQQHQHTQHEPGDGASGEKTNQKLQKKKKNMAVKQFYEIKY